MRPLLLFCLPAFLLAACTRSTSSPTPDAPKSGETASPLPETSARAGSDRASGGIIRPAKVHRATATACPKGRGMGKSGWGRPNDCKSDAQCTAGKNGRCEQMGLGAGCTYDDCYADQDCAARGTAKVCACRASAESVGPNHCVSGNCTTDADCGAFRCSPTLGPMGHIGGIHGYFCHTASDACVDDEDCGQGSTCRYASEVGRFQCSNSEVRPG